MSKHWLKIEEVTINLLPVIFNSTLLSLNVSRRLNALQVYNLAGVQIIEIEKRYSLLVEIMGPKNFCSELTGIKGCRRASVEMSFFFSNAITDLISLTLGNCYAVRLAQSLVSGLRQHKIAPEFQNTSPYISLATTTTQFQPSGNTSTNWTTTSRKKTHAFRPFKRFVSTGLLVIC